MSNLDYFLAALPPMPDPLVERLMEESDQSVENLKRVAREWFSQQIGTIPDDGR